MTTTRNPPSRTPKILGFSALGGDPIADPAFEEFRTDLGGNLIITMTGLHSPAELSFLKSSVTRRIPAIVFLPEHHADLLPADLHKLASDLLGIALAVYPAPATPRETSDQIAAWADAFLLESDSSGAALAGCLRSTGLPHRFLGSHSWEIAPHPAAPPRHGFTSRPDLLEFLDARHSLPLRPRH